MCNAPKAFFVPTFDARRVSRSKLHKYLIRDRPEEKIISEIDSNRSCVYQQTTNGYSSLFLAASKSQENVVRKLMSIYETDYKVLKDAGYNTNCAVLIALGAEEIKFFETKAAKIVNENEADAKEKFIVLLKEANESSPRVKTLAPKTGDDQKIFLEIIVRLRANGTFDIDTANQQGETLIHVAAAQGMIWLLEKLLEFGARHDVASNQGNGSTSAFEFACINNQLETVKWFHKKFNPDLHKLLIEGQVLFKIAQNGSFEVFDYLIQEIKRFEGDEQVQLIFARREEYQGNNVLMQAVYSDKKDFVLKCLKFNPDLNLVNLSNENILSVVLKSWSGDAKELVATLIKKQPNLLVFEDSNQLTPLHHLAAKNNLEELVDIYQHHPSYKNIFFKNYVDSPTIQKTKDNIWCETPGHSIFSRIVAYGHFEMAEFILDQHADEFDSAEFVSEALGTAATRDNCIDLVKRLQKLKCFDINVPEKNETFPLVAALSCRNFEMYRYLLESCKINDLNAMIDHHTNNNLLHFAVSKKSPSVKLSRPPMGGCFPPDVDSSDDESDKKVPQICIEPPIRAEDESEECEVMFEIFNDLIKRGVRPQPSLLLLAVEYDNFDVVRELMKLGESVNEHNDLDSNVLHFVRSAEVFRLLAENDATSKLINEKNSRGLTPFMIFASFWNESPVPIDLFQEFIKLGADVNIADKNGKSPLHEVSTVEWVKLLLEHGADINAKDNQGENAVHTALRLGKYSLAGFILRSTDIDRFAVTNDEVSYIGCFSPAHVDYKEIFDESLFAEQLERFINGNTLFGERVISNFIFAGDLRLFEHPNVDLFQTEADGRTCLHNTILSKPNLEVVKKLVEKGLDINAVTDNGFTALMQSLDYGCKDVANFLINLENIDLNLSNAYGFTALHYAARNEFIDIVCKLLIAGADPNVQTNSNETFVNLLGNEFDKKLFKQFKSSN